MASVSDDDAGDELGDTSTRSGLNINEIHVLRPVTLRQVLSATGTQSGHNELSEVNGRKFSVVRVVATLMEENILSGVGRVTYKLDDGTNAHRGPVHATYFLPKLDVYESLMPASEPGSLPRLIDVSVTATIVKMSENGRNFLRIISMHAVKDPHEIYHHVLEVIATGLLYERGLPPCDSHKNTSETKDSDIQEEESGKGPEVDEEAFVPGSHPTNTPAAPRVLSRPPAQRRSPHDSPPNQPEPRTPTKPSRNNVPQSPVTPTTGMDSLSMNSPPSTPSPSPGARTAGPSTRKPTRDGASTATGTAPTTPSADSRRSSTRKKKATVTEESQTTTSPTSPPPPASAPRRGPRLSMRDPLSHLSSLQRSILLMIKDETTMTSTAGGVTVGDIVQYIQASCEEDVTSQTITDALNFLVQADLIEPTAVDAAYRAKDAKGKKRAYDIPKE
ncbi:hypothetical protein BC835DRAFT_226243 [Cytidiella melzeri]|nr:hypothetical protein BC835DRAFT_226243 [Cytidiella melzeri]